MLGLGPLEPLLEDDTVTDIMVNGPEQVFVERGGKLVLSSVRFRDAAHVAHVCQRIAGRSAGGSMRARRWSMRG